MSCGFAGVLNLAETFHSFMEKQKTMGKEVEMALMDMYGKCGAPEKAIKSFNGILQNLF